MLCLVIHTCYQAIIGCKLIKHNYITRIIAKADQQFIYFWKYTQSSFLSVQTAYFQKKKMSL